MVQILIADCMDNSIEILTGNSLLFRSLGHYGNLVTGHMVLILIADWVIQ